MPKNYASDSAHSNKGEIELNKQETDLIKLERARNISDKLVKKIDERTYEIESSDKRNQGEVNYMVYFHLDNKITCTCKDFMFRNTEETQDYQCKHIIKVIDLKIRIEQARQEGYKLGIEAAKRPAKRHFRTKFRSVQN